MVKMLNSLGCIAWVFLLFFGFWAVLSICRVFANLVRGDYQEMLWSAVVAMAMATITSLFFFVLVFIGEETRQRQERS